MIYKAYIYVSMFKIKVALQPNNSGYSTIISLMQGKLIFNKSRIENRIIEIKNNAQIINSRSIKIIESLFVKDPYHQFSVFDLHIIQEMTNIKFLFEGSFSYYNTLFAHRKNIVTDYIIHISNTDEKSIGIKFNFPNSDDYLHCPVKFNSNCDAIKNILSSCDDINLSPVFCVDINPLKCYPNLRISDENPFNIIEFIKNNIANTNYDFQKVSYNNKNFHNLFDIDGISGYAMHDELEKILCSDETTIFLDGKSTDQYKIPRSEVFIKNSKFCKTRDQLNFRVGSLKTSLGELSLFLVFICMENNKKQMEKRFWIEFESFLHREWSNKEFFSDGFANIILDNFTQGTLKANMNITLYRSKLSLLTRFLKSFSEHETFFFFSGYGQKLANTFDNMSELIDKLSRVFNLEFIPNLKIDLCKSFFYNNENSETYSTFLTTSSFKPNAQGLFKLFQSEKMCNINASTTKLLKSGRFSLNTHGIYKFNIYSSSIRTLLDHRFLKMKLPQHSIELFKNNFFGYSCKSKRQKKHPYEPNFSLLNLKKRVFSNYSLRFETKTSVFSLLDIDSYITSTICNSDIVILKNEILVSKLKKALMLLREIYILGEVNLFNLCKSIYTEYFLLEFIIRGGRNKHILTNTFLNMFNDISFENIDLARTRINETVLTIPITDILNTIAKLLKYVHAISESTRNDIKNILNIIELQQRETFPYIFDHYITDVCKLANVQDLSVLYNDYRVSNDTAILSTYISFNFSTRITNLSSLPFAAMVKILLSTTSITEEELHRKIFKFFIEKNILYILNDSIPISQSYAKTGILQRFITTDVLTEKALVEKQIYEYFNFTVKNDITKNYKLLKPRKTIFYSIDEMIRLFYGFNKHKNMPNTWLSIKNDLLLGFILTRSIQSLKDAYRNAHKKKNYHLICEKSRNLDILKFTLDDHISYLECFDIEIDENIKKLYETLYRLEILELNSKYCPQIREKTADTCIQQTSCSIIDDLAQNQIEKSFTLDGNKAEISDQGCTIISFDDNSEEICNEVDSCIVSKYFEFLKKTSDLQRKVCFTLGTLRSLMILVVSVFSEEIFLTTIEELCTLGKLRKILDKYKLIK